MARATRKAPMRTCVGCRQVHPKRELLRIVRTPQGEIVVDATGKRSGRGAYICPSPECLEAARKGRHLERALQQPGIEEAVWAHLDATIRQAVAAWAREGDRARPG